MGDLAIVEDGDVFLPFELVNKLMFNIPKNDTTAVVYFDGDRIGEATIYVDVEYKEQLIEDGVHNPKFEEYAYININHEIHRLESLNRKTKK